MKVCPTCSTEYDDDTRFCPVDGTTLRSGGSDLIGSVIADRFHILKKLGEGGMGAVYLGEHVKMGRKSAIKVMAQAMAQDTDSIARFNREAENAARINHPNVCAIYDFGETSEGLIYLAMEFIEGEALTDLLNREGALAPKRAATILRQTADALQAAHELGIVHRDLKPDNIMIARDRDGADLVKVVDFGIAKAMGGETDQNVTKTGLVVGTPEYMSPEQLSGDKLDGRSDTYSLGLVLFRMLTGVLPFQADTSQEVMIKRLTDDPMPLIDALPGAQFPPALQAAMDRALERMPGGRYASAAEFGHDVWAAAVDMPDVKPRIDTDGATQQFEGGAVFGGATAALPDTQVGASMTSPTEPPDSPAAGAGRPPAESTRAMAAPVETPPKRPVGLIAAAAAAVIVGGGGAVAWLSRDTGDTAGPIGNPIAADSGGVSQNTASLATNGNVQPSGGDPPPTGETTTAETVDPGGTEPNPVDPPPTIDTAGRDGPAGPRRAIPVDVANAADRMIDLIINSTDVRDAGVLQAYRDTAQAYYEHPEVAQLARADAAYVMSLAYFQAGQRNESLRWIELAIRLKPEDVTYLDLRDTIRGNA